MQLGPGLEVGPLRHAEIRAVKHRQKRPLLHVLADIHMHLHYTTADQRCDFGQFVFVGLNRRRKLARGAKLPTRYRRNFKSDPRGLLRRELQDPGLQGSRLRLGGRGRLRLIPAGHDAGPDSAGHKPDCQPVLRQSACSSIIPGTVHDQCSRDAFFDSRHTHLPMDSLSMGHASRIPPNSPGDLACS